MILLLVIGVAISLTLAGMTLADAGMHVAGVFLIVPGVVLMLGTVGTLALAFFGISIPEAP